MTERTKLYRPVLAFVMAIAKHPGFVKILTEKRVEKKQSPGLQGLGEEKNSRLLVVDTSSDGISASLNSCGYITYKQARTCLELAEHKTALANELRGGENSEYLRICNKIIEFYNAVRKSAPEARISGQPHDPWAFYHAENRVKFTDDVLNGHTYYKEFLVLTYSPPGRMLALGKEIASLSTSLPLGVFLKIGNSRQDVMKVLIVGAEGSPYAGGLFIFDLFLDETWPSHPPRVNFVLDQGLDRNSSGGRSKSLNPHISADGEICLSLLNTWHGSASEKWQPNKSTILSVLVSIQAMLLGDPTPEEIPTEGSLFNAHVQCKTVYYAMLWWLMNDKSKKGIWGDMSKTYWKYNGDKVLMTVKNWSRSNRILLSYDCNILDPRDQVSGRGVDLVKLLQQALTK